MPKRGGQTLLVECDNRQNSDLERDARNYQAVLRDIQGKESASHRDTR